MADTGVFLIVGIAVIYISAHGLTFGCLVMLFCLLGRAVAVALCGVISNAVKKCVGKSLPAEKKHMLSWKHMFMMWHAGLRGGIALVLALKLGPWVDETEGPKTLEMIRNGTLVVICGFLLVFGGTTELLLKRLGIRMGDEEASLFRAGTVASSSRLFQCLARFH